MGLLEKVQKAFKRGEKEVEAKFEVVQPLMAEWDEFAKGGQPAGSLADEYLEMYELQPTVRGSIDKVAKIFMGMEWSIAPVEGKQDNPERREVLGRWLERPNDRDSFSGVLYTTVVRLKTLGEAFWAVQRIELTEAEREALVTKQVTRLWNAGQLAGMSGREVERAAKALDAEVARELGKPVGLYVVEGEIRPNLDKWGQFREGEPAYFQWIRGESDPVPFERDEIIHFRFPNPRGGAHGLSPLRSLHFLNKTDEFAQVYNQKLLENQGRVGGVLEVKGARTSEQVRRVSEGFASKFSGGNAYEQAGQVLTVEVDPEGGVQFKPVGVDPREIEYLELLKWNREQMSVVLNVPLGKLGVTDKVHRSNMEEQSAQLMQEEIKPLASFIADPLNRYVHEVLGWEDCRFAFQEVDLRSEREIAEVTRIWAQLGGLSINELLAKRGKPPVEGGDIYLMETPQGVLMFERNRAPRLLSRGELKELNEAPEAEEV